MPGKANTWFEVQVWRPDADQPSDFVSWHAWSRANDGTREAAEADLSEALKYYRRVRITGTKPVKEINNDDSQ